MQVNFLIFKPCAGFNLKNLFVVFFKQRILKGTATYKCFIFPSFHENSFSPQLPFAAGLLAMPAFLKLVSKK